MTLLRPVLTLAGLLLLWEGIVWMFGLPPYILPPPHKVAVAFANRGDVLLAEAGVTVLEMLLGLLFGALLGAVPPSVCWCRLPPGAGCCR